jgi:hypothetical protein
MILPLWTDVHLMVAVSFCHVLLQDLFLSLLRRAPLLVAS